MQEKQIELLIFKMNVLRNYKNTEERNDCKEDLLEKIGEHTKRGKLQINVKNRFRKVERWQEESTNEMGDENICPLLWVLFLTQFPQLNLSVQYSAHKGRVTSRPAFRITRTES